MYSKKLLKRYIDERLKQKDWPSIRLAEAIGMRPSNYQRSLESEAHSFTLQQFADIAETLDLTPEQIYHVLTGKKSKEAAAQLVITSAKKIVGQILGE